MGNSSAKQQETVDPEVVARQNTRRAAIANELLVTERSYSRYLSVTVSRFLQPLRSENVLPEAELRSIFSVVESLAQFHASFVKQLEQRIASWSPETLLGDVIQEVIPFLKMYTDYINNYDAAVATLKRLANNSKLEKFLAARKNDPECNSQDIYSLLIMPVQRLPRYVLLLQELVKNTSPKHPDYSSLQSSLSAMQELTHDLNSRKKLADERQRLVDLQTSLLQPKNKAKRIELLLPHRKLVFESQLTLRNYKSKGNDEKNNQRRCKLLVCNDVVIVAVEQKKNLISFSSQPQPFKLVGGIVLPDIQINRIDPQQFEIRGKPPPPPSDSPPASHSNVENISSNISVSPKKSKSPDNTASAALPNSEILVSFVFSADSELESKSILSQLEETCEELRRQQRETARAIKKHTPRSRSCCDYVKISIFLLVICFAINILLQQYLAATLERRQKEQKWHSLLTQAFLGVKEDEDDDL